MTPDSIREALTPRPIPVPGTPHYVRPMTVRERAKLWEWQTGDNPRNTDVIERIVRATVCDAEGRPAYEQPNHGLPHPLWVEEEIGEAVLNLTGFHDDSPKLAPLLVPEPGALPGLLRVEMLPALPGIEMNAVSCYIRKPAPAERMAFDKWQRAGNRTGYDVLVWWAAATMTDEHGSHLFAAGDVAELNGLAFELTGFTVRKHLGN